MGRWRLLFLLAFPVLSACKLDVSVKDLNEVSQDNYQSTTITVTSPGIADGVTPVTITITVKNNGVPVAGYTPQFAVTGSGNTASLCTVTDALGVSTCLLRSNVAELKTVQLVMPAIAKSANVTFNVPAPPMPGFAITSGGGITTGAGMVSHSSIGLPTTPIILEDPAVPGTPRARMGLHGIFYEP
jgi:hypothetical protein